MKNHISVFVNVFNEEKRIGAFLKSFAWCDDIIVLDKSSTDRTLEFCTGENVTVIKFPYTDTDGDLFEKAREIAKHDWISIVAMSDVIDYSLAKKANELIESKDFKCNTILVPFKNYILGLDSKFSPWYMKHGKRYFLKKDTVQFSNDVHSEIQYDTKSVYYLRNCGCVYHLTHQSVLSQNERHMRYTQREADILDKKGVSITRLRWGLVKMFFSLLFKNLFVFRSNDVFALNVAFLTYYVHRFLFTWEKKQNVEGTYEMIRNKVVSDLEKEI